MKLLGALKKMMNEALGVPNNLITISEDLYDEILDYLVDNYDQTRPVSHFGYIEFTLGGPYNISDFRIEDISVLVEFEEGTRFVLKRMFVSKNLDVQFPMIVTKNKHNMKFGMTLMVPDGATFNDVVNFLITNENEILSSIAHELKHQYDSYKSPAFSAEKFVDYTAIQSIRLNIPKLTDFLYSLYFFHDFENLVRPSELLAELKSNKSTKESFLNDFLSSKIYKEIKFSSELTYEDVVEELKGYHALIYHMLVSRDMDVNQKDVETNVQIFLFLLRRLIINTNIKLMGEIISSLDSLWTMREGETEFKKFFTKFINKLNQGDKFHESDFNPKTSPKNNEIFYNQKIQQIRNTAEKMKRKLAKLYAALPSEKDGIQTLNKKISAKGEVKEFETDLWFKKEFPPNQNNFL